MLASSVRFPLVVAALGLLATGCFGGSHAASTVHSTTKPPPKAKPLTRLTVTYSVGYGDSLGRCPRGAVCTTRMLTGSNVRVRVARFSLRCDPPAGTYRNPRAACAAIAAYIELRRGHQHDVCECTLEVYRDTLTGTYRGKPVDLPIGPCEVCGMGRGARHDVAVLLPA